MTSPRLPRRALITTGSAAALYAGGAGLGAALGGCQASTTGDQAAYETVARGDLGGGERFDNALGWTITLDEAWLALGYLRYAEGSPIAATPRALPRRLSRWLVEEARAHPGHYDEGLTLGEMRSPQVVELLGPEQSLGTEPGVTGDARSALVRFEADDSSNAPRPEAVALAAGLAERDGEARAFVAVATRAELLHAVSGLPEVPGCPLEGGPLEGDGIIRLEVQLRLWLDQVDFSLVPAAEGEAVVLTPGEPPHNAFLRGVQKAAAYRFRYEPV